jgi:homopolymeric O-antigen transport system ATP-binding protein
MSPVIAVENLSKKYIISHQKRERYFALRDVLANGAKRFTHKLIHPFAVPENDPTHEVFWALKDINFDIMQGDRVGIIGRNGAGKSTLLKILSRITEPTSGKITIKGRVASLLEVGTGFHPELTGRENIFLNGAVLGMRKVEIKKKFDEIVAFAEVEKFLDTPVKHYSSGMYMRLAFAVAAHLEPDILIVDEVLAVGDVHFHNKCIGKMQDAGKEGRTVIFVSHNMAAINSLCTRGMVLTQGKFEFAGDIDGAIKNYLSQSSFSRSFRRLKKLSADKQKTVEILDCKFYSSGSPDVVACGEATHFEIEYVATQPNLSIQFLIGVYDIYNTCVLFLDSAALELSSRGLPTSGKIFGSLSKDFSLFPGTYTINVAALLHEELIDHVPNALQIIVHDGDFFGTGRWPRGKPLALVKQNWRVEDNNAT